MRATDKTNHTFVEDEKPENYNGRFVFTPRTVTFGHVTLQLSNVSGIRIKRFKETIKAVYDLNERQLKTAWKAVIIGLIIFLIGAGLEAEIFSALGFLTALGGGLVVWYYHDERNKKKDIIYNYHGLFFDLNSGRSEVLWSDDGPFAGRLFNYITHSMNDDKQTSFIAHFHDNRIENLSTGDKINYFDNSINVKDNIDSIITIGDGNSTSTQ
jgi:hypothetical protein